MLKPIDIHNAEFKRSFRGYNQEEVDDFLDRIVSKYEDLFKENQAMHEQIQQLEQELRKYQNKESDIYGLITLTRETATEAKEVASQQAQSIIDEANVKANVILEKAKYKARQIIQEHQDQLHQMQRRLQELAEIELKFKKRMKQLMETIWAMLEDVKISEVQLQDESAATKVYRELSSQLEGELECESADELEEEIEPEL
ncbi:MAG: DivIVA domain-containing protein [Firmicutes bacterium]|nr:DivIVA domain-containing protein [Bacillota bacterium]NLL88838.1 DivIVA domain-containing protein [Bacillota bacterium]HKM17092.1 DivIVA domain-containing protein [Limnochordia bacterium]